MMLESLVAGRWQKGSGQGQPLVNPTTGEVLGHVDQTGIDPVAATEFARNRGTPALQALGFAERGELLGAVANVLIANRDRYFEIARLNSGNTRIDATIDIDGAIGALKWNARLAKALGAAHRLIEPGQDQLTKEPVFFVRHLWSSRPGIALQVNAFNFPAWGMWEKIATALVAGVASVAKPASATAWLPHEMVRDVDQAGVLPAGALSLVCGPGKDLIGCLGPMDSLAFTGSADTAQHLRAAAFGLPAPPRVNIEADSINATLVGPDADPASAVFELARREVGKALSIKAGQLCTNIRRVLVPADRMDAFAEAIVADAGKIVVGDPAAEETRMGPLVNETQRATALEHIGRLKSEAEILTGADIPRIVSGADAGKGAFLAPTILRCADPQGATSIHEVEVFGPCLTLMPYRSLDEGLSLVMRGGGALALSLFSDDAAVQAQAVSRLAPWHGRVLVADSAAGKAHTGHAIVMPQCTHGGPGHAGGGEELGGLRGLRLHMQRTAVQGSGELIGRLAEDSAEASL